MLVDPEITIIVRQELMEVRGNAIASDGPEFDKKAEAC